MFWGLKLKSNKKYSQNVETGFHLSMAALDTHTANDEDVQVLLLSEDESYVLCTLNKNSRPQCLLNLDFSVGDQVTFISKGNGVVSLTGSLLPDDDMFGPQDSDDEDGLGLDAGSDSDAEEEEKVKSNGGKNEKQQRLEKKKALSKPMKDDADSDEDSDDESFVIDGEAAQNMEDDDSDDDDDDDDDEEDVDDEEEEDDDDSDSDEEVTQPQAKKQKVDKQQNKSLQNGQPQQNGKQKKEKENENKVKQHQQQKKLPKRTLQGGVIVEDLKVGAGVEAKHGKKVQVYYEGRLKENNRVFDSTKAGPGFKFGLGRGEVIKGWDIGVAGMKVGGKRRLVIPANMAYGAKGSPPTIPANATLVFDVELKNVLN